MALARHSFAQRVWIRCTVDIFLLMTVVQECCKDDDANHVTDRQQNFAWHCAEFGVQIWSRFYLRRCMT